MTRTIDIRNSCAISRFAAVAAVFLCGAAGLLIVELVPTPKVVLIDEEPPNVIGGESSGEMPKFSDIDSLVSFCSENTTSSRGFVVMRNGTCILVPEPTSDPVAKAMEILAKCAEPDAKFLTERIETGDVLVTFRDSVFHRVAADEIRELEDWSLLRFRDLLSSHEKVAAEPGWVPPAEARLGLVGRERLLRDAKAMEIVKILRPDTSIATAK